ncbi:MAG: UDP-2,3-diacylglucosamine diphosphatase LpxI, partial [Pseudomonadota bacterium]
MHKIALLAFEGGLPQAIFTSLEKQNLKPYVVGFHEFPNKLKADTTVSLGKVGALFRHLRDNAITDICLAGRLTRPNIASLRLDWIGFKTLLRLFSSFRKGDDALLKDVLSIFDIAGFRTLSIADICPDLMMPLGCLTSNAPSETFLETVKKGREVLESLSKHDIGQAIAIADEVVLAIEALEGTDAMILRCQDIPVARKSGLAKPILIKAPKKQQTRAADLPVFGPETVNNLIASGFSGAALA